MYKKVLSLLLIILVHCTIARAQWMPQTVESINLNWYISSIAAVNEDVIWAIADSNDFESPYNFTPKFLRTTNGGLTWKTGTVGSVKNTVLLDISAIDSNTAWVTANNMAGSGGIFKTTDGGVTWSIQDKQANILPVFIHFFDAQNGVQINQAFIHTTNNGGTKWTRVQNIPPFLPNEYNIIVSSNNARAQVGDTIWVGTSKGRVYRSTNRGQSWQVSQTGLGTNAVINSLAFKDGKNGLAVSTIDGNTFAIVANKMARTTDGGETWTTVAAPTMPSAGAITYVPGTADSYVLVSPTGPGATPGSAYTNDGGMTWTVIDTIPYQSVAFIAPNIGWAGGDFVSASHSIMYKWVGTILNVTEGKGENVPHQCELFQNYPNPFNPATTIEFALPQSAFVTLKIYNLLGEEVATLVAEQRAAGIHRLNWDARGLASGVYLYRLEADSFVQTEKLILMR